ncbi:hypothetical protein [Falsiroseomonas tokyonensis]|uniref:Glycine zipper domain-containing protein n=1 Tax=Falsiroseomonas tokyonensis TaxID=430521 RepID=A0ABV7BQM5_9PROT|nr:hypothetical protein [Falsiroseomonas tokyonensis]MBU8536962.1 hypothetical protein [Falsiroseomonas tokyonensis]
MKTLLATLLLLSALVLAPQGAQAQPVLTTPAIPSVTIPAVTLPAVPAQQITAGHAVALGVGLFVGATAGSALIHGGALAAAIGGLAGLAVGHWVWTEAEQD